MGMVKKMYGKQIVFEEINQTLGHALDDYLKSEKFNLLGEPLLDESSLMEFNFDDPGELKVKYEIGVMPEIKISYDAGKTKKYTVEITEETLAKLIDELCLKYGKVQDSDSLTDDGCVELQFTEMEKVGLEKENGLNTRKMILLKDVIQKTTKTNLLKLEINDSLDIDIIKAFESRDFIAQHILGISEEQLENVSANFKITLVRKCSIEKAEMNQELFDMVLGAGKAKNEKEFTKIYEAKLAENYDRMSSDRFYKEVVAGLISKTKLALPDEFLKKWLVRTQQNNLTEEDVQNNYQKYQGEIKEQILLDTMLNENQLKIEGDELNAKMDEQIRAMFYLPEDEIIEGNEQLMAYRNNMKNNKDYINYTVEMIRRGKLVKLFEEKVKFTEKKIKAEDFLKLDK